VQINPNSTVTLTWATQPQKNYRLAYKDNLSQATWTPLTDVTAIGTQLSIPDDITGVPQRFYRIELLNP
jgi:hypothetical protein